MRFQLQKFEIRESNFRAITVWTAKPPTPPPSPSLENRNVGSVGTLLTFMGFLTEIRFANPR